MERGVEAVGLTEASAHEEKKDPGMKSVTVQNNSV